MELNRDEIVKALECCTDCSGECDDCPLIYDNFCGKHLLRNALTLINQLTEDNTKLANMLLEKDVIILEQGKFVEENERLKTELRQTAQKLNTAICLNDKLTADNEWLRAENESLKIATNDQYALLCDCHDTIAEMLRQKEAYTVMKMHSMLCEGRVSNDTVVIVANQIAKEMLEG